LPLKVRHCCVPPLRRFRQLDALDKNGRHTWSTFKTGEAPCQDRNPNQRPKRKDLIPASPPFGVSLPRTSGAETV
jgi:hypothetical protein